MTNHDKYVNLKIILQDKMYDIRHHKYRIATYYHQNVDYYIFHIIS